MEKEILKRLTTLGHPHRMAVFRLLVRRYPDDVSAGDIGAALGIKPSTLSVYLSALREIGLISQTRHGTSLLYKAQVSAVQQIMDYLLLDCGRGRPDIGGGRDLALPTDRKLNVLFICSANSARSIFAEAILRHEAGQVFNVYSAGVTPATEPNPMAMRLLRNKGYDVSDLRSQNIDVYQAKDAPELDFVFTVCDESANEECPPWSGQPISAHWGVPDPVTASGSEAERALAFQNAFAMLRHRIQAFAALPFETLDRSSLQYRVDDLAKDKD
ncbi:helix-turn-helix domain-containing protein [Rhodobacteraceae bacterium M382]|nr:helix-turn-helix domain-containing protein [Rhodobacteraceae bacterium M382]